MARVEVYADHRGKQPVVAYIGALARSRPAEAASIARYIDLLEEHGEQLQPPVASIIDRKERIFELRPGNHRVAYAFHRGKYVVLHAWRKQTQKVDKQELRRARLRLDDWKRRNPD